MKDIAFEVVSTILFIAFTGGVIIGLSKCSREQDEKDWNNGYCECGGHFEYEQAVGHQIRTSYIYKCDSCGRYIEIWELKEAENEH